MITLKDYLTSSGKYPDREKLADDAVRGNAANLLIKVNSLLLTLGIKEVTISSGFRPAAVNAKIANASKKSLHMTGSAIDIADPGNKIGKLIQEQAERDQYSDLLHKHGLWLEDLAATASWAHLDQSTARKNRPVRIFKP